MARTDDILRALSRELELRRMEIDRDPGLKSVGLVVYMSRRGRPESVGFRLESVAPVPPSTVQDQEGVAGA